MHSTFVLISKSHVASTALSSTLFPVCTAGMSTKMVVTLDLTEETGEPKETVEIQETNEVVAIDCDEDDNSVGEECPICFKGMEFKNAFVLKCGHIFCRHCLQKMWQFRHGDTLGGRSCPMCRFRFPHHLDYLLAMRNIRKLRTVPAGRHGMGLSSLTCSTSTVSPTMLSMEKSWICPNPLECGLQFE